MGNVADKGKWQGYYGITGEDISYENSDDFLVVTLTPASTVTSNSPEDKRVPKSPFETPATSTPSTDTRRARLEGSVDSGYAEVAAKVKETHPEPIPSKPTDITDPEVQSNEVAGLSNPDCRTAKSLGNCHAFFGFRAYHYNDMECEGNKHILDNDL